MPVDMSSVTVAAAAAQILSNTLSALNAVRERAKSSKDTDLKDHISTLYDSLLSLKEAVMRVTEENSELRRRITELELPPQKQEPELRQVGSVNYYYDGDKGPCCQPCYDGKGKLTVLTPAEGWNGGVRRQCTLCGDYFYEKPMDLSPKQIGGRRGRYGWMGS
jgi:hypothetical protein